MKKNESLLTLILFLTIILVLGVIVFLQFLSPTLYGVDGYYHIKIPYIIRDLGLKHNFPWTQFSTFKNAFSDKEFLFHILILPFTYIQTDILTQAKLANIFIALLFFITFALVQKKYVIKPLIILSTISLLFSLNFLTYINYLRPKTLAMVLLLILLYLLIEKKWVGVFLVSIIYSLTHISFPIVVPLALGVEILRYIYKKEFCYRNFIYSLFGIVLGMFFHPNFPANILSLYLNGFLVPWSTMFGKISLNYGLEWNPSNTKMVLFDFLIFFVSLFFSILLLMLNRVKVKFHTIAFFFATFFFLLPSMFSSCYWYFTYPIGLIFITMFFSDWLNDKSQSIRISIYCIAGLMLAISAFSLSKHNAISNEFSKHTNRNLHYERIGKWMAKNLPENEVIFHTTWSDSPYFICFNDKDYYLNILDPIYMYYYSPDIYKVYNALSSGRAIKPLKVLKKIFKTKYGYAAKRSGLYRQITERPDHFEILLEDDTGIIFEVFYKGKESYN